MRYPLFRVSFTLYHRFKADTLQYLSIYLILQLIRSEMQTLQKMLTKTQVYNYVYNYNYIDHTCILEE